ncbi:MAG TPA: glycogen/starch synthase, partial [Woeseiaceae bacterium]
MAKKAPLRICLATSELSPLAKTGGLADVCAALSAFLQRDGHDVRVLLPRYSAIDESGLDIVPVDYLQQIPIQLGTRSGHYSIDSVHLPGNGVQIYLLRCPDLYDRPGIYTSGADEHLRFILLSRAAIEMCQHMGFAPDVFHCHDWHTALIPLYLKSRYAWDRLFANTRSVLTIHNIGYQGVVNASVLADLGLDGAEHELHQEDLGLGRINFLKTGILHADLVTTVSPTYAREIQGDEYGMGLQDLLRARGDTLVGILNGVDYDEWNPQTDPLIPANYSRGRLTGKTTCKLELMKDLELAGGAEQPLIGMVTRLTAQKGIDLIQKVLPPLLQKRSFALAVLGSGEPRYERFFNWLQQNHRDRVCFYRGFNNRLAHWIEAGSDMFLMPSRFEPCGLNQMYSLRYGTVPIVRETGGLADSVQLYDPVTQNGDGIVFRDYNEIGLDWAINAALDLFEDKRAWKVVMQNGMAKDLSWDRQGKIY